MKISALACICLMLLCFTVKAQDKPGWTLVWNDEFNGNSIDLTKWDHETDCWGGGNGELQCYTARQQNSFVSGGNLHIVVKQERYTGTPGCTNNNDNSCTFTKDYTSARIRTKNSPTGSFKYGRFEFRAKLPKGKHLWPAIWMLPTDYVYGPWAASGEIDIVEARGQEPYMTSSTLHYGGVWPNNRYFGTGKVAYPFDLTADFHVYALEWEEKEIRTYVDDILQVTFDLDKNWYSGVGPNPYTKNGQPWDQKFHMLLNVAVGGGFFPPAEYGTLSIQEAQNWANPELLIDYVRVYKPSTGSTSSSSSSSSSGSSGSTSSSSSSSSSGSATSSSSSSGCSCTNSPSGEPTPTSAPSTSTPTQSDNNNNLNTQQDNETASVPSGLFGGGISMSSFVVGAVIVALALLVLAVGLMIFITVKASRWMRNNSSGPNNFSLTRA